MGRRDGAGATSELLQAGGLRQPVEIVRDRWGVAHIFAQTLHDVWLAQGYAIAADGLFTLDV